MSGGQAEIDEENIRGKARTQGLEEKNESGFF